MYEDRSTFDEVVRWITSVVLGVIAYALIVIAFTPEREPVQFLAATMLNIVAASIGFLVFFIVAALLRRKSVDLDDYDLSDVVDVD